MEASSDYPNVSVGEGYAVAHLDDLGDGPGFRKVRKGLGVTAFGVNAIVLPPGIETGFHYHDARRSCTSSTAARSRWSSATARVAAAARGRLRARGRRDRTQECATSARSTRSTSARAATAATSVATVACAQARSSASRPSTISLSRSEPGARRSEPSGRGRSLRDGLAIPLAEITLRTSRSSGPGGQHANVTASRVEASFDVLASTVSARRSARACWPAPVRGWWR